MEWTGEKPIWGRTEGKERLPVWEVRKKRGELFFFSLLLFVEVNTQARGFTIYNTWIISHTPPTTGNQEEKLVLSCLRICTRQGCTVLNTWIVSHTSLITGKQKRMLLFFSLLVCWSKYMRRGYVIFNTWIFSHSHLTTSKLAGKCFCLVVCNGFIKYYKVGQNI